MIRRLPSRLTVGFTAILATLGLLSAPAAASVSATWGWTTDTLTMSFYGGIPYHGCELAALTVPNSGSTGTIQATTWTTIVVGPGGVCSNSTIPSSLNANTIRTRTQVYRNGYVVSGCTTGTVSNGSGQGIISASVTGCTKSSSADATWSIKGTYSWYDYDDTTWRAESVFQPVIED